MAADRTKTTLMIALIIFVMMAFILSVTTYLGFQQKAKEMESAQASRAELEKANRERTQAQDDAARIRAVIGTDKDTADAVEAERTELFDRKFAGFDKDPKSFLRLVEWLADAIKNKDEDIRRLEAEKAQIRQDADAKVAQAQGQQQAAEEARDAAKAEQAREKERFDGDRKRHQADLEKLQAEQKRAFEKSDQMEAIVREIADVGPLLSPELRRMFSAAAPEGEPEPWPKRVGFIRTELRARENLIKDLNATLARLRVADPGLQELVRKSAPENERIDGFDGRIASVNSFDRTVLVVCDSTAGMRPGLLLSVYSPDDPRPRPATRKGMIEVAEVEGPTLARARIRRDSATDPIVAGDGVATSLWSPGGAPELAIVGYVRFGAGRGEDAAALKTLVGRTGARVVDTVTPTTALVVDAGVPSSDDLAIGLGKDWKNSDDTIRKNALARAKEVGVRVVSLDGLLDMLGLDRESLDGRRLPHELGAAP